MISQNRFETEQWEDISTKFGISAGLPSNPAFSTPVSDLLDEEKCAAYLDKLTDILQSPSRMITASQFSKRYAALFVVPSLYAISVYDKEMEAALDNCHLESALDSKGHWLSHVCLNRLQVSEPFAEKRDEWRDEAVKRLFAGHIAPLWHSLAKVAKIPMPILWENTAVRVFALYEKWIGEECEDEIRTRGDADFHYLVHEAPTALFGEAKNPLGLFHGDKCESSNGSIRMRKTCCYYYEVSPVEEYCLACPKVKGR